MVPAGDRGQAVISLMPDADGTGSRSLLDSILSTFLIKLSSDVWVHSGLEIKIPDNRTLYRTVQ